MQNKIIYTENGEQKAATGKIVDEDEHFVHLEKPNGNIEKFGKRFIMRIKPWGQQQNE